MRPTVGHLEPGGLRGRRVFQSHNQLLSKLVKGEYFLSQMGLPYQYHKDKRASRSCMERAMEASHLSTRANGSYSNLQPTQRPCLSQFAKSGIPSVHIWTSNVPMSWPIDTVFSNQEPNSWLLERSMLNYTPHVEVYMRYLILYLNKEVAP